VGGQGRASRASAYIVIIHGFSPSETHAANGGVCANFIVTRALSATCSRRCPDVNEGRPSAGSRLSGLDACDAEAVFTNRQRQRHHKARIAWRASGCSRIALQSTGGCVIQLHHWCSAMDIH
jgi:hypothetical protein